MMSRLLTTLKINSTELNMAIPGSKIMYGLSSVLVLVQVLRFFSQ